MKIQEAINILQQLLPPKATFVVEVDAQYNSENQETKVLAHISIRIRHLDEDCYSFAVTTESLPTAFASAVGDFKKWYGNICGVCWGTKRISSGECSACSTDNSTTAATV